ncbi:hypothetical protein Tco_0937045 [Tanacetum coccineum]|uniref:Uncharacterized protein n=1 Tax=Tanacetum coccineum TaxID=301880 RepID=A0ABQ5DDZ0_9ASTR
MALLVQSFRATLPHTNNPLRTSSNTRNKATIQDGRVVIQNVQGRQNLNQNQRNCTQPKRPQNSDYFKDKMLLMQAQRNDVDDEAVLKDIFMAICLCSDGVSANQQAGPSNASILSEVHTLENAIDHIVTNEVQQSNVIDSTSKDSKFLTDFPILKNVTIKLENKLRNHRVNPFKMSIMMLYLGSGCMTKMDNETGRCQNTFSPQVQKSLVTEVRAMKAVFENLEAEVGTEWTTPLGRQCPLVKSSALKCDCIPADPHETIAPVVQIVLWYLDSGCSKHMTGDRIMALGIFVKKFYRTVEFGTRSFGAIMGSGDVCQLVTVEFLGIYSVDGLGQHFSLSETLSPPLSNRKELLTDALCGRLLHSICPKSNPKNFNLTITEDLWLAKGYRHEEGLDFDILCPASPNLKLSVVFLANACSQKYDSLSDSMDMNIAHS